MGSLNHALAAMALVVGIAVVSVRPARADGGIPELSVAGSGVDADALRKHLLVELADLQAPERIEISRTASSLHVTLAFEGRTEEREVMLRDVAPSEVARVVSLVIGEAARVHRAKAEAPPEERKAAVLAAPVPAPSPAAASPAPSASERTALGAALGSERTALGAEAAFGARAFRRAENLSLEPRLSAFLRLPSGLRFDAGAFYLTSSETDALGRLTLHALGGSLGTSLERPLGSSLLVRFGPRADLGSAFGRGTASGVAVEGRASEPWFVVVGEVAARYRIGHLSLLLAGDVGGVVSGIALGADGRTPLAWTGATFGARLGLAYE